MKLCDVYKTVGICGKIPYICVTVLVMFYFLQTTVLRSGAADTIKTSNRFNVVFVLDSSGSMNDTDPDKLRCEAVSLFTGLLAMSGNHIGSVVFSDHVLQQEAMFEVTSVEQKKQFVANLSETEVKGWTNTGEALVTAVQMLETQGDPTLPDIIIYLTDGNTLMGTQEELDISLDQKADAIQSARDGHIKIYSVCLNAAGRSEETNPEEMRQISEATGGDFKEVNSATDLRDVFQQFYELIYSTSSTDLGGGQFDSKGFYQSTFEIPSAGVEEVNIITSTENELVGMKLIDPSGDELSPATVSGMTMESSNFSITKINFPEGGTWKIEAQGSPDTSVKISMIFNAVLSVSSELKNPQETYEIGDTASFRTILRTGDKIASDSGVFDDYTINAAITDANGNTEELPLAFVNGEIVSDYNISDYGTFQFNVNVHGYGISAAAEPITIYVGNTPPTVVKESLSKVGYIWPYFPLECSVDLSEAAVDKEDKELNYSILSSSFMEDSYELYGHTLSMKHFDVSKGSFTVVAADSMGATCEFEVYVSSRNIPMVVAILIGAGILVLIIITGVGIYLANHRYFHGRLCITVFDENGVIDEVELTPIKGRYKIRQCGISDYGGISGNAYFEASGKNTHIFFFSKSKVYASGASNVMAGERTKKVQMTRDMSITISADKEFRRGIRVRFEPTA